MKNIFCLKKINDLPPSIQKSITKKERSPSMYDNILSLFDKKKQLTVNEIIVAYYRLYKKHHPRSVSTSVYYLKKTKKLKQIGISLFEKNTK